MLTGVIYGAIVVVWAAYLVPLALRRHDEATRSRSIARFSSAMRVLARRGATVSSAAAGTTRVVITPRRQEPRVVAPHPVTEQRRPPVAPRSNRVAERAAAARRRRVLCVLAGVLALVTLAAVLGLVPLWSVALPLVTIAVFLGIARRAVRQANETFWAAAAAAPKTSRSVVVRRAATRVEASRDVSTTSGAEGDDEPTITLSAAERKLIAAKTAQEEHVTAVSLPTSDGGSLWDPLPVTLPTYVSAPVVKRAFRTIDLSEPGLWSSGHSPTASQTVAETVSTTGPSEEAAEEPTTTREAPGEVARAVNG